MVINFGQIVLFLDENLLHFNRQQNLSLLNINKRYNMKFSVDKQEGVVVYELLEEKLTSLNAPVLKSELVLANTEGFKNIVVDLGKVKFVDSSGLSAILIGHRLCKDEKGIFALCGLNDAIKGLIKISQLEEVLHTYSTQSDALEAINKKKKK